MKHKILFFLLCLMYLSPIFAQTSVAIGDIIYLFPVHICVPMDNDHNNDRDKTDFNQIRATINGKDLSVKADTGMPARAEVRKENGALITDFQIVTIQKGFEIKKRGELLIDNNK